MSDLAFQTAAYPSMTTKELQAFVDNHPKERGSSHPDYSKVAAMVREISRREAVEAGDYSQATDGERLRAVRAGKDIGQ